MNNIVLEADEIVLCNINKQNLQLCNNQESNGHHRHEKYTQNFIAKSYIMRHIKKLNNLDEKSNKIYQIQSASNSFKYIILISYKI